MASSITLFIVGSEIDNLLLSVQLLKIMDFFCRKTDFFHFLGKNPPFPPEFPPPPTLIFRAQKGVFKPPLFPPTPRFWKTIPRGYAWTRTGFEIQQFRSF